MEVNMKLYTCIFFLFFVYSLSLMGQAKHTFVLYTNDAQIFRADGVRWYMSRWLASEIQNIEYVKQTHENGHIQLIGYGPFHLAYDEKNKNKTYGDLKGAFQNPEEPLYRAIDSLKKAHGLSTICKLLFTKNASVSEKGSNILTFGASATRMDYVCDFLKMVTKPTGKSTTTPYRAEIPEGYPGAQPGQEYTTLGGTWAHLIVPHFAHLDTTEYFGIRFPLGDKEHNVLDPQYGWKLHQALDEEDFGVRTYLDTLTLLVQVTQQHLVFPAWNDKGVDTLRFTSGGFYANRFENIPQYAMYNQSGAYGIDDKLFQAYAVAIPGKGDAFAVGGILVRFVDNLEVPGIATDRLPDQIYPGDTLTVELSGTPELMTSWQPQFSISEIDNELIENTNTYAKFIINSSGTGLLRLSHNSLRVLEDETIPIEVSSHVKKPAAPENLIAELDINNVHLSWGDMSDVSYNIYRRSEDETYTTPIASEITTNEYTDATLAGNGTYYYAVSAENEAGESEKSDEAAVVITSVNDAASAGSIAIFPNPAGSRINVRCDLRGEIEYRLINIEGEVVAAASTTSEDGRFGIDISALPPRQAYFLILESRNRTIHAKFTKR
jgi:hypothetical protein